MRGHYAITLSPVYFTRSCAEGFSHISSQARSNFVPFSPHRIISSLSATFFTYTGRVFLGHLYLAARSSFFPFCRALRFFFTHVRIEESHFVCCDRRVSNLPSSYFAVTLFSYWTIQQFRPRNIYTKYPLNNARFFYIKRYIETVSFLFKCALRPILSKIRKKIPRSFRHKNTLVHRGRRNFLTAVKWSL